MPDAYSIKESLQGALLEFIRGSGCRDVDIEELVREVVGLLASYREEDVAQLPQFFIFLSATALRALAATGEVTIGRAPVSPESALKIVKDCAPLADGGWSIFAIREDTSIRYGLFRAQSHSIAVPAEEAMRDLGVEVPVISHPKPWADEVKPASLEHPPLARFSDTHHCRSVFSCDL